MLSHEEYMRLDAVGLAELIKGGQITAVEATQTAIELAEEVNPKLNALVCKDYDRALERAKAATKDSAFAGVPSFIKDNDNLEGLPTRQCSLSIPDRPALKNSDFVDQFLAAGLNPIGKTALPEFGLTATTESIANGKTRNPWNLEHSTGGSSGGSAAMTAAGVVPAAHGNDGGGSIRIPSSCCGLIGIKSSRGRLHTMEGTEALPIDLISEGILGRTVRDTATFLSAGEKYRAAPDLPELGLVEGPGTQRLKIGMFTDSAAGAASHPDVVAAVEKAARYCTDAGHSVEPMQNPFTRDLDDDFMLYWSLIPYAFKWMGKSAFGPGFDKKQFDVWTEGLARIGRRGLLRAPFAIRRLKKFAAGYAELFGGYDLMLCPVLSRPPVKLGTISPDVAFDTQLETLTEYCCFTPYQNLTGTPAISLPVGRSETGLPIGVQFAAQMGEDRMLLELAFELEQAGAWDSSPAPLLAAAMA